MKKDPEVITQKRTNHIQATYLQDDLLFKLSKGRHCCLLWSTPAAACQRHEQVERDA